ncbi:putative immunity protein [Streptomyces sp. NPDC004044]
MTPHAACFAARAAGQAVATAHVPQHAFGAAYYALEALAATDREQAEVVAGAEREWQAQQLPERLRQVSGHQNAHNRRFHHRHQGSRLPGRG